MESVWVLGDELRDDCREDGRLSEEQSCFFIGCPGVKGGLGGVFWQWGRLDIRPDSGRSLP